MKIPERAKSSVPYDGGTIGGLEKIKLIGYRGISLSGGCVRRRKQYWFLGCLNRMNGTGTESGGGGDSGGRV